MSDERAASFEAMFVRHVESVRRFAHSRLDAQSAEDITAETFLAAWRDFDRLPPQPLGWLLRVARNKIVDHYRAGGRRADAVAALAVGLTSAGGAHDDALADHDWLRAAFAALSPTDQEVLRLIAWDCLSAADAATALGISTPTFAVRLHRARARLRHQLDATATSNLEGTHDHRA